MRPAKGLFDIGGALFSKSDPRLVVPDRVAPMAIFVESFIHYMPGEDLAAVVLYHRRDVFLKQVG